FREMPCFCSVAPRATPPRREMIMTGSSMTRLCIDPLRLRAQLSPNGDNRRKLRIVQNESAPAKTSACVRAQAWYTCTTRVRMHDGFVESIVQAYPGRAAVPKCRGGGRPGSARVRHGEQVELLVQYFQRDLTAL